jgi:peptidoglycan/xylan/chitin deacetylase (PgdA/CDA1 family)
MITIRFITTLALLSGWILGVAQAAEQLPNLSDEKPAPRFAVGDRTWPAQPGDAEICLWKDDKMAPVTFTVDDNCSPDVPWWLEMGDKYGIKVTWFLISKNIEGNGWGGTWDLWKQVLAKGHDIQSHTHTHLHIEEPGWQSIEWEYTESKKVLEENLPGTRVRFLAYPGGPNSKLNDRTVAAKIYAGARGVTGTLVPANVIDYFGVRAVTESSFNNPEAKWADIKRVLDPADKVFRTWMIFIYHGVKDKSTDRPLFVWLAENKQHFWFASFAEASLYGQQRDTATLKVTDKDASKVVFSLNDKLDDAVFDYPLTVKVHLPSGWTGAAAEQEGKSVGVEIAENGGVRFALVEVVPDRGPVVLTPAKASLAAR